MSYEYRVMKIESCLNQTGPSLQSKRIVPANSQELFIYSSSFFFFFFRIVYLFLNPNYQNKYILFYLKQGYQELKTQEIFEHLFYTIILWTIFFF